LNGQPLAQVNSGSPETATWLHTDQLGTPRFGTNSAGTQVWAWNSDAFGNGTPTGSVTVNLRLPGQFYDPESGLSYNWNRYYSPALGRYITSDPIGLAGGMNTFNYVGQSPLMWDDFLGWTATCPPDISGVNTNSCTPNAPEGFSPYSGFSSVYHCGGTGYMENREDLSTTEKDPVAECVYDQTGGGFDNTHPYRMCQGTADHSPVYLDRPESWGNVGPHRSKDPGGPNGKLPSGETLGEAASKESEHYQNDFKNDPEAVKTQEQIHKSGLLPPRPMTPMPVPGGQ
jgi:RHS repeat-associated protein